MQKKKLFLKGIKYLTDSDYRVIVNAALGFYNNMPDEYFLKKVFKSRLGYELDLNNPKTLNEKIQWLKLHDRKEEYVRLVDKYLVKEYIAKIIGEKYIIPTLDVWNNPDEIDFEQLPDQFVLKCNHNSGLGMYICKDKSKMDKKKVLANLKRGLKENYYLTCREWPYSKVERKIIAEQYMVDESGKELKDYKIFCFNGIPMYIQVDFGRFTYHERNLYSTEWKYMGFASLYPTNAEHIIPKPVCLNEMLSIAGILSKNIPFVRVDLYVIREKIYFGELTFYHGGGFERFTPQKWDKILGDLLDIESIKEQ